jgi:hypothetical protein
MELFPSSNVYESYISSMELFPSSNVYESYISSMELFPSSNVILRLQPPALALDVE